MKYSQRGFTLIELMVVIAIIGLLSSVVLASLNGARIKSKDAVIKAEVRQFETILGMSFIEYGNYCDGQTGWIPADRPNCNSTFSGVYASQFRNICNGMFNNANKASPLYTIYTGTSIDCQHYSIMVLLNNGNWYCSGNSGAKGEYASYAGQPGCYNNP